MFKRSYKNDDGVVYYDFMETPTFKDKVKEHITKMTNWCHDNKEFLVVIVPVLASTSTIIMKTISRSNKLRKEKALKNLYCYDRSLGHYWKLKRELTNSEWVEIDKRKAAGDRLADILDEFRVLK